MSEEQKRFDEYAERCLNNADKLSDDQYLDPCTQAAWDAWLSRSQISQDQTQSLIEILEQCADHIQSVTGANPGSDSEFLCIEARNAIVKAREANQ